MPWAASRRVEASELETAPAMRSGLAASASMKKFTVDPVPTPITVPPRTCSIAASVARYFPLSWLIVVPVPAFADPGNNCARLRGHSRRFGIGGGLSFEGAPPLLQRPYFFFAAFFLVAFFLVAFFALAAMIKSPCRVSPGRSIYRNQF